MIKKLAYYIVYKDLTERFGGLFIGLYDAKKNTNKFMYGIATVMDVIALGVSDETYYKHMDRFEANMIMSEDRAHV